MIRGGSWTAAASKLKCFMIIVIVNNTKPSILDVSAVLDPPLMIVE